MISRRLRIGVGALVVALLIEGFVSLATSLGSGEYGAPFPIGVSCGPQVFGPTGCVTTANWAVVAVDVAVTWAIMLLVGSWSGFPGLAAAVVSAVLFVVSVGVMASAGAPFVGLPIPVSPAPAPLSSALVYWIDLMFWSLVAATIVRLIRRRA